MKILAGAVFSSLLAWNSAASAALQTTPYIALHSTPLYAQAKVLPYANAAAPKGGYLSQAGNGTFDNLNSMNGKGTAAEGTNFLFDSLMSRSLDEPGVLYPLLAEKVSFDAKNPQSVIFHLNPRARFSDGSAVTAQDVKATFDLYQTQSNPGLQMYLSDLKHTEVLSAHQVKMTFHSANNSEMPLILAQLPIYAAKEWKTRDFKRVSLSPILGSGPYVIEQIDAGRSISYKRNRHYWAKDLMVNRGRYNFDQLKYVYYRNLDVAFEGFKSGQYSLHEEYTARKWVTAYHFPAMKAGMVKKYALTHYNPIATQSFVLNNRRAPMQDIRFRQALTYAYDFEWQNKALFYGQYRRLQSYFSNSELAATSVPNAAEMAILKPYLARLDPVQRQGVLLNWQYPRSDGSGFNRQNLLTARMLLLNAGYRYHNGRLLDPQGRAIRLEFLIHQDGLQRTLMPFVRNLKRLGIDIQIRQVDVPQYIERMRRNDFDLTTNVLAQSLTPGNEQAQFWSSQAADQVGNYNYAGIKNPVIDAVVEKLIQSPNREQLVVHTRVLDRLLRAGYYQIPTYGKGENWLVHWNMYQHTARTPRLSKGIDYWWSDAKQQQAVSQYLRQQ